MMYQATTVSGRSLPARGTPPRANSQQQLVQLTKREKEFLQWSEAGKSSWEIAMIVDCSEANVNYHFNNIRRKFGVSSRHLAGKIAREQGLIQAL
ncbi:LuxR family transcriptional regulator [Pseudomonas sp. B28(2017)]|uniref:helix-turn-helix transcriptional regulator n=1 Tax=Pseudomonas sp. B28(2017) TaxID=1981730 RepID=UPI00273A6E87|nr:LuxR family transcriptional regulator [Pseudomonas sp. B28(2017)]